MSEFVTEITLRLQPRLLCRDDLRNSWQVLQDVGPHRHASFLHFVSAIHSRTSARGSGWVPHQRVPLPAISYLPQGFLIEKGVVVLS